MKFFNIYRLLAFAAFAWGIGSATLMGAPQSKTDDIYRNGLANASMPDIDIGNSLAACHASCTATCGVLLIDGNDSRAVMRRHDHDPVSMRERKWLHRPPCMGSHTKNGNNKATAIRAAWEGGDTKSRLRSTRRLEATKLHRHSTVPRTACSHNA